MASGKCAVCKAPATKKVIWADGRAYQPACPKHVKAVQMMITRKNGKMAELAGVQDLTDIDLASSAYPDLERKPGGPDNWVEKAGGLPDYIERIAKRLHYEKGFTISHAIATAVNTVKRWARMGKVAKYGDPHNKHVTPATVAKAIKAVAEWEAKKRAGSMNLTDAEYYLIDHTTVSEEFALDLADEGAGAEVNLRAILSPMNIEELAARANAIQDPKAKAAARAAIIDLASTIAPRNARGRASDGRRSYKKQGRWKHGFVPVDSAAHEAKAKGSPIAMKRTKRLYGGGGDSRAAVGKKAATGRVGNRSAAGRKKNRKDVHVDEKSQAGSERAKSLGAIRHSSFQTRDQNTKSALPKSQKEASKASRVPKRAKQNWDEIPDNLKTMRNGQRYVLAEFGGKGYITKWVGGVHEQSTGPLNKRKKMVSITAADAARMTPAQRSQLLANPNASDAVKRVVRKASKVKVKK